PSVNLASAAVPLAASETKLSRRAARLEARRAARAAREEAKAAQAAKAVANTATSDAPAAALPDQTLAASDNPPLASSTSLAKPKAASAKPKSETKSERSVLKLSKISDADMAELDKLVLAKSEQLSAQSLAKIEQASVTTPKVSAELAAAQELSVMQQKVRMLEAEANRLQQRSLEQDRLLQASPADKNAYQGLFGIALVLIAALLAIVWLLWRMQQLRQQNQDNWHQLGDTTPTPANVQANQRVEATPPSKPSKAASAAVKAAAMVTPPAEIHEDFFAEEAPSPPTSASKTEHEVPPEALIQPLEFERSFSHHALEMPTVDEVTDAMHEAEFWMSLGKPEKAAEVLELYGRSDQPTSPVTWLYLFDLYRTLQDEEKYTQLRTQFQRRFNGLIPAWNDEVPAASQQQGLENQPALLEKIAMLWGTHKIVPYLEELIIDNREGMRTGFALPTYREILFLLDLAHNVERLEPIHALEFH
ncbi:MAG: hypothetical protein HYZ45_13865, partial [Burkholderiales bacterium]|nr:hypothetical protein [Burkholderiales bacterium]